MKQWGREGEWWNPSERQFRITGYSDLSLTLVLTSSLTRHLAGETAQGETEARGGARQDNPSSKRHLSQHPPFSRTKATDSEYGESRGSPH